MITSWPRTIHINTNKEKDFISSLIDSYCRFNLRKSIFFTEEGIEKYKKMGEFVKYVSNTKPKEMIKMKKILLNNNVSPIKGLSSLKVTSSFGNRTFFNGKTGKNVTNFHSGIDLIGGTMVVATSSGTITSVRTSIKGYDEYNSAGNYVLIYHGNNVYTKYCHLKYGSVKVKKNDIVQPGTILGTTGATGFATGVHLHYAVKENGKWVDPLDYLTGNKQLPSLENSTPIIDTGSNDLISYKVQKGDTLTKIAKCIKLQYLNWLT